MTPLLFVVYATAGVVVAAAAYRLFKLARPIKGHKSRKWVERSEVDRRQHEVSVPKERRKAPRRQEDIAKQFLDRVEG